MRVHVRFRVSWGRQFRETTLSRKWPCKGFRSKGSYSCFFAKFHRKYLQGEVAAQKSPEGDRPKSRIGAFHPPDHT